METHTVAGLGGKKVPGTKVPGNFGGKGAHVDVCRQLFCPSEDTLVSSSTYYSPVAQSVIKTLYETVLDFLTDIVLCKQNKMHFLTSCLSQVPDSDFMMSVLAPQTSETGTSRRQIEIDIMNRMQDFLQELESQG